MESHRKPRIIQILKGKDNAVPVLNDATYNEGTGKSGGMDPHIVNFSGRNQLHVPAASSPVPPEKGLG
jgi:hypothetical protein